MSAGGGTTIHGGLAGQLRDHQFITDLFDPSSMNRWFQTANTVYLTVITPVKANDLGTHQKGTRNHQSMRSPVLLGRGRRAQCYALTTYKYYTCVVWKKIKIKIPCVSSSKTARAW